MSQQGGGFFRSTEITSLLALLGVIDNPHQDVPLIAVLRSPLFGFTPDELSAIPPSAIENSYIARIKPGAFGLVIPLGAKAGVTLPVTLPVVPAGPVSIVLTDVSGKEWSAQVRKAGGA